MNNVIGVLGKRGADTAYASKKTINTPFNSFNFATGNYKRKTAGYHRPATKITHKSRYMGGY